MMFGFAESERPRYLTVKLFSKNSNLCDHNPPTSQTDGRTDDMRSQYRALHFSASRGKNYRKQNWFFSDEQTIRVINPVYPLWLNYVNRLTTYYFML